MMRSTRVPGFVRATLLAALGFFAFTTVATAECKNGAAPDYSDVTSVMFERNACGGFIHKPDDLMCSAYWVYFGNGFKTTYSQATKAVGRGAFVLDSSLDDARALLAKHDFFGLTPPDTTVTDIEYSVLSVRICNVVRRLMMYPIVQTTVQTKDRSLVLPIGGDQQVADLFADFDALVARSTKERVSDHFLYFNLNVFESTGFGPPAQCRGTVPFGVVGEDCSEPLTPH